MTTPSLLQVASWIFLLGGIVSLAIGAAAYFGGGTLAVSGAATISGTFWLVCAAVAFFLRSRLA